jgi:hypothetical protein
MLYMVLILLCSDDRALSYIILTRLLQLTYEGLVVGVGGGRGQAKQRAYFSQKVHLCTVLHTERKYEEFDHEVNLFTYFSVFLTLDCYS